MDKPALMRRASAVGFWKFFEKCRNGAFSRLPNGLVNKYRRGWAGAQRRRVTMFSAIPVGWVMLFSASERGGSSYFKPRILKFCKLPKPSVTLGA